MINSAISILTICACVIGAGYLSGDELIDNLGTESILCMAIIASMLYAVIVYALLKWSNKNKIYTLEAALNKLPNASKLIVKLSIIFATITLSINMIMLAGSCISDISNYNGAFPLGQYAIIIFLLIGSLYSHTKIAKRINNIALLALLILLMFTTHSPTRGQSVSIDLNRIAPYAVMNITLTLPIIINIRHEKSRPLYVSIGVAIMLIFIAHIVIYNYNNYDTFYKNNTNTLSLAKTAIIAISAYCTSTCCLSTLATISRKRTTITVIVVCICTISVTLEDTIITYALSNTAILFGYISIISVIIQQLFALRE